MADCYKAPELKGNYCREMCPLGKNMPKIENAGLDRISLRMLSSFKKINEATQIFKDCCKRAGLTVGSVVDTGKKISELVKSNATYWDVIQESSK